MIFDICSLKQMQSIARLYAFVFVMFSFEHNECSGAAVTRLSVTSVVYSEPCQLNPDCEVTFSVCLMPTSTSTSCETTLVFVDRLANGETTWTPTISPKETYMESGQSLPTGLYVFADVSLERAGGQARTMLASGTNTASTASSVGSNVIEISVDDTSNNVQATITLQAETICETGYYGDTCSTQCTASADSTNGFFSCDSDGNKVCTSGYTGASCTQDIDECASSPCQNSGTCTNTAGSYACRCVGGCSGTNCENGVTTTVQRTVSSDVLQAITTCPNLSATLTSSNILTIKLLCGTGTACLDGVVDRDDEDDDELEDVLENVCILADK